MSVTVGATLATATAMLETLLLAPSESLTWTLTTEVAGPSLKVTSKLPAPVALSNTRLDTVPTEPPLVAWTVKVSTPGSLVVKV